MKVYATYYNADSNEGRGPMALNSIFLHRGHAENFIDAQEGVQGRRCKWSVEAYGDWKVTEFEVIEHDVIDAEKERAKLRASAYEKLTPMERAAIGLKKE